MIQRRSGDYTCTPMNGAPGTDNNAFLIQAVMYVVALKKKCIWIMDFILIGKATKHMGVHQLISIMVKKP